MSNSKKRRKTGAALELRAPPAPPASKDLARRSARASDVGLATGKIAAHALSFVPLVGSLAAVFVALKELTSSRATAAALASLEDDVEYLRARLERLQTEGARRAGSAAGFELIHQTVVNVRDTASPEQRRLMCHVAVNGLEEDDDTLVQSMHFEQALRLRIPPIVSNEIAAS